MQINCWAISLMLCMDQILVGQFDLTFRPFMEWLLSFRRFLPDVTIHAMIKRCLCCLLPRNHSGRFYQGSSGNFGSGQGYTFAFNTCGTSSHPRSSTNLFLGIRFSQFDTEQRIYILPKPTRDFAKARPIVHYSTAWARKLGSAISTLLIKILNTVFRSILEFPDVRAVIEGIRRLFTMESFAESAHCLHQADIAAFYNQVQLSGILMSLCLSCTRMHRKPNKV